MVILLKIKFSLGFTIFISGGADQLLNSKRCLNHLFVSLSLKEVLSVLVGSRPACSAKNIMERPKLATTSMDREIVKLVNESDHKTLAIWASDCAERVLPYFERNFSKDNRPREAINAGRAWVQGEIRMIDARKSAFAAHAAARNTGETITARQLLVQPAMLLLPPMYPVMLFMLQLMLSLLSVMPLKQQILKL